PVALHEVNADDLNRVVAEDAARTGRDFPLKQADRAGTDDHHVKVELFVEFLLPLFAKIRRAENAKRFDLATVQHFAGDEERLNRLADANVVGNEHPNSVEA